MAIASASHDGCTSKSSAGRTRLMRHVSLVDDPSYVVVGMEVGDSGRQFSRTYTRTG